MAERCKLDARDKNVYIAWQHEGESRVSIGCLAFFIASIEPEEAVRAVTNPIFAPLPRSEHDTWRQSPSPEK